jgi:uncharacterized protein (DUF433 family)
MVNSILGLLGGGYDFARISQEYPELTRDDIRAAIDYAASKGQDGGVQFVYEEHAPRRLGVRRG